MPLADDDWTRGKCAFKALQYMAAGMPTVCSPVGANVEVVEDGVDGLLPKDNDGWVEAMTRLAASPALRARMGEAARRKVEGRYTVDRAAGRLLEVLG
jgi:glycosyltransferase involved in cell wall biosynthesis